MKDVCGEIFGVSLFIFLKDDIYKYLYKIFEFLLRLISFCKNEPISFILALNHYDKHCRSIY